MVENDIVVKVQRVVLDPRMSLKQFAKFCTASVRARETVLQKSKYPGGYIPKYHEIARKIICETFSANFDDHELYFEEFTRHAVSLRKEAMDFPVKTDDYKNRAYSASALESMVRISGLIAPFLKTYVLENNLRKRMDSITIAEVKLGAMSDMICYTDSGLTLAGFIKFNFTSTVLKKEEAAHMLFVLRNFTQSKHAVEVEPRHCILVDVVAAKVYQGIDTNYLTSSIQSICTEIKDRWNDIQPPLKKEDRL